MDQAKVRFLFGEVPRDEWGRLTDEDERIRRFEEASPSEARPAWAALQSAVAAQVFDETPPEVWRMAHELLGRGIDRHKVLDQLTVVLSAFIYKILHENAAFDERAYATAMCRLPLPDASEVVAAIVGATRANQGIDVDRLLALVLARLARESDDIVAHDLVDSAIRTLSDRGHPLALLAPERLVLVGDLTAGIVLTHRLSAGEAAEGRIEVTCDLAAFDLLADLTLAGGSPVQVFDHEEGKVDWGGPGGWLGEFKAGDLVAIRVSDAGVVTMSGAGEPEPVPGLVPRLRAAYDTAVAEAWLPIGVRDLVLNLLLEDRTTFAAPRPPLSELCTAAALDVRMDEVAHEDSVWDNGETARRQWRISQSLDGEEEQQSAAWALEAADDEEADAFELRSVLRELEDPDVLVTVADELLGPSDSEDDLDGTDRYAQRLVRAAKRPSEIAVARWLACVVAERRGDPLTAERHLKTALNAAPEWELVVDRAAWYASDRGDAQTAARLWRALGPEDTRDLEMVEQYEEEPRPLLRRNDPCWCGSGRKYKNCHLDKPELRPLAERIRWVSWKAASYLERRGGRATFAVVGHATARVTGADDEEAMVKALKDPLVIDCTLTDGGWLQKFLDERGALLPGDEALLVAAWVRSRRTVYEITGVRPGEELVLRVLATGERRSVTESIFSRQARAGGHVCGCAVSDGEHHHFLGCLFSVPSGKEKAILALCDQGRGRELIAFVARDQAAANAS